MIILAHSAVVRECLLRRKVVLVMRIGGCINILLFFFYEKARDFCD